MNYRQVISLSFEQVNPYKGNPLRPWVRLRLVAVDNSIHELELLADTGSPSAIVLSRAELAVLNQGNAPDVNTNFGILEGGWLRIEMPELGLSQFVIGYGSDPVASAAKSSSPDFAGLAGLPLLRLMEYGGNATEFWLRKG